MRLNYPVIIASALSLVGGGLAGAVFTWYINRPDPTTITYGITTTTIGADPTAKSAVPNLKIQIGKEEIGALYVHQIEFSIPRGPYLDKAEVAATFPASFSFSSSGGTRIFGMFLEPPSPLHTISCTQVDNGVRCGFGPLSPANPANFRITLATNQRTVPTVLIVGKGIEVVKAEEFLARETRSKKNLTNLLFFVVIITGVLLAVLFERLRSQRRLSRQPPDSERSNDTAKAKN